jgi:glyoxylase-like metal-dependent hydrolase (beta-lactamase superfamily II)
MQRWRTHVASSLTWLLVAAATAPAAAQDFENARIETVKVADGLHMLRGVGGNLALVSGPDGAVLVDDQYAPMSDKIRAAVRAITAQPIRFVVNTHWHSDHTGGNEEFGRGGAIIVAHENVRRRMSTEQFIEAFGRRVPPAPPAALPVVTFADGVTFHWAGEEIVVRHVAGAHTDGDAVVWFRNADAVHAGDLFFHGMFPFIDVSSGGSIAGMIAGVDRVLAEAGPATKIIPGHGPLADRAALETYRRLLVTAQTRVRDSIGRGLGADALIAEAPLAEFEPDWSGGALSSEQFLRIVHADLSR